MQMWDSVKLLNTRTVVVFLLIGLCLITLAPWYDTNNNLHKNLNLLIFNDLAKFHYCKFFSI